MNSNIKSTSLITKLWSEDEFRLNQNEWGELLNKSNANPIFLSWNWLYNWWSIRREVGDTLFIIAIYENAKLIAIAPLYIEKDSYFNGALKTSRLQFIGKRYSGSEGIRSEYMDFIIQTDRQKTGMLEVLTAINDDRSWTELSLNDFNTDSPNYPVIKSWLSKQKYYSRIESQGNAFIVDCSLDFDSYLKTLGKNTRLKLYNRRKLLEKKGCVEIEFINQGNMEQFFELINAWQVQRWGTPFLNEMNQCFFNQALGLSSDKLSLKYTSVLKLDGKPLSIMVNIDSNDSIYNIQTGYIEDFDKKIALGTLHMGYMLEHSFEVPKIKVFDFLEGRGKNSNYKSRIAIEGRELESRRWFRSGLLKLTFRFYDKYFRQ